MRTARPTQPTLRLFAIAPLRVVAVEVDNRLDEAGAHAHGGALVDRADGPAVRANWRSG